MESRLGIDEELKKVVDEIVSAVENSKYQARPLTPYPHVGKRHVKTVHTSPYPRACKHAVSYG
jgi:hypothetical protein